MKFKVGDKVRAITNNYIDTSLINEWVGEVIEIGKYGTVAKTISTLSNRNIIGKQYIVTPEHFELVEQPKLQTIHHSPIVYRVYDELKRHIGSANAISAEDLAAMFDITKRDIRRIVHTIRNSGELEKAIGAGTRGYFVCTKEDAEKAIQRLLNQAFSTLKVARALEKKVGLNGQIKLKLGEYFNDTYQSLGE